jgi:O-antigen/teichoic acid export membrane protein
MDMPGRGSRVVKASSSLRRHAVAGMGWVAWGSGAIAVLKVVVLILLTRLLTPADFGLVSAGLIVVSVSLNFSQLGLGPALVQRSALEPRHLSAAFVASTSFGMVIAAAVWVGAPLIAGFFRMEDLVPVVRALGLLFPIAGVGTVPESLLQRELRFRLLANRDVLAYGVGYGAVGVGLALLGWGVWALVAAQLTQAVIRTVILLRAAPPFLRARPTWTSFLELMEYGVGQSAARLGMITANQADNLVVGRWLGAVPLGEYSRAFQLVSVPATLLGDVIDKVLFPTMARVQDDPRRLATAYLEGTALLALVTLPAGVVSAILAPDLVAVAFGSRWSGIVAPFQVLALGMTFRTCHRVSDSLSRATGKVYRRAWRQGLYAGLVFLGALIGQIWGLTGVAVGVLAALFANYVLMAQLSLEVIETSWARFFLVQLPAGRLALLMGAATLAGTAGARALGWPPAVGLATGTLAALGSAVLAAWVAPTLALGEHGVRTRDTLRALLLARGRLAGAGESR